MTKTGIRVIVVEDDPDLRESLVEGLSLAGHDVLGVGSGREFHRALDTGSFSVALIDLGLPDQDGNGLAEYARRNTSMGIIVLTARGALEDRLKGYDAGADLYFVKPTDCRELAAAVSSLATRVRAESSGGGWLLDTGGWHVRTPSGGRVGLTARELQFMKCLAAAGGNPVSRDTLLSALGDRDDESANRALDSLVRRLRKKIESEGGAEAPIRTAYGAGYSFSVPLALK